MNRRIAAFALVAAIARPAAAETVDHPPMAMAGASAHNAWLGRGFVERYLPEFDAARRAAVAVAAAVADQILAKTELQDVVATRDRVVVRYVFTGTLSGAPMMGAPSRGQKVRVGIIDIWSVKEGKLHEHWDQIDWTSFLAQLGVPGLPAPFYQVAGVQAPAAR